MSAYLPLRIRLIQHSSKYLTNLTETIDQIYTTTREKTSTEWTCLSNLKVSSGTSSSTYLLDGMSTIESALDIDFAPPDMVMNIRLPCFVIAPRSGKPRLCRPRKDSSDIAHCPESQGSCSPVTEICPLPSGWDGKISNST